VSKLLSGRVKKTPSSAVSSTRYDFIKLEETEPDLGLPAADDYVLTGKVNGSRLWVEIGSLIPGAADLSAPSNIFDGEISHKGLILTEGNKVDQVKTFTQSLQLGTVWQETGIKGNALATGTYVVQLLASDGNNIDEYYSGTMSWWAGNTQSTGSLPTDEIVLHRAGAMTNGREIYLRTWRSEAGNTDGLRLQIYCNMASSGVYNYIFKFRKLI
jgi:hypothetical protein